MSELEEPPAKVLKIDNINGVTHVTELDEMPHDASLEEQELMGEESGIIEGGADGLEQEGQEEWLSEGILTDDDFNPHSQEEPVDRTDSQIETSQEEHLDSTMDSETSIPENEANTADAVTSSVNGESIEKQGEGKRNKKSELNTADKEEKNELNFSQTMVESQTYTQNSPFGMESETNTRESETNISESVTNIINSGVLNTTEAESKTVEQNIEETMKHLDGNKDEDVKSDAFDSLLTEKPVKTETKNVKSELKEEHDTDGNDTDDLLRMLGEDNSKTKKKLTKTVKDIRMAAKKETPSSEDDDDFVYEGASVKKLKVAQSVLAKKQTPIKAKPEAMDDGDDETDASEDESKSIRKMFNASKPNIIKRKQPPRAASTPNAVKRETPPVKHIVKVVEKTTNVQAKTQQTPPKQYQNTKRVQPKQQAVIKVAPKPTVTPKATVTLKATPTVTPKHTPTVTPKATPKATPTVTVTPKPTVTVTSKQTTKQTPTPKSVTVTKINSVEVKKVPSTNGTFKPPEVTTPAPFKASITKGAEQKKSSSRGKLTFKEEPDEIIDGDEFLDDDEFDMDEDEFAESDFDKSKIRQRIMRPEMMDEEIPSDEESHSEGGSLYDELPSSDSEDMDDWFTLDIRAEKAGDYIPLLGSKAKELLLEEKNRVTARLQTLKKSLSTLTENGKKQAEELREATISLAELDDLLKAT